MPPAPGSKRPSPRSKPTRSTRSSGPGLYGSFLGRPIKGFVAGLTLLAGLILLAACANLGSLFAARTADRSREVALRLALGSSRNRILRQLMTEATIVSILGGILGLAGSVLLLHRLAAWRPFGQFPINVPVTPDAKVYVIALVLAIVSGFLFGIVPVRQVLRANPYEIVKAGIDRFRRPPPYPARRAAGPPDRNLRRARHLVAGRRSRPRALAQQPLRLRAAWRHDR